MVRRSLDLRSSSRSIGRPLILGHRGAAALAPENTLAGVRVARRMGADGVEIDVRITGDGALVVFHDPTPERLCGEPRPIAKLSLADVRALRVSGEPIPTLDELLEEAAGLWVNVELKSDGAPTTATGLEPGVAACLSRRPHDLVLVSSFCAWALRRFRRVAPDVPTGVLIDGGQERWLDRRGAGRTLGALAVHAHYSLCDARLVARLRAANQAVVVWTVNDPGDVRRMRDLGVDAAISDDPGRALAALTG